MRIVKLETPEQFLSLKKNDQIIVQWTDFFVKHHQDQGGCTKIMHYYVYENKKNRDEIICRVKGNHFFNWKMFLGLDTVGVNTSQAMEIYKIEVVDMREILFKAKRVDNGEWIQGFYYRIWDKHYILWGMTNGCPDMIEVDGDTLCQFTGLLDIEGSKIFDGDVITSDFYPFYDAEDNCRPYDAVIKWIFSSWQYVYRCIDDSRAGISDGINNQLNYVGIEEGGRTEFKVISNIHDEATK